MERHIGNKTETGGMDTDYGEVARQLRQFGKDVEFFNANIKNFMGQFPNKWVGVYEEQVVAVSKGIKGVLKKTRENGFDPRVTHYRYLQVEKKRRQTQE